MKRIISILLFIITTAYMMPVKEILKSAPSVCMTDSDDDAKEKEKEPGKKIKELYTPHTFHTGIINTPNPQGFGIAAATTEQHHTVETPPPDIAS